MEIYIEQILFHANNKDYKIILDEPISAGSYEGIRKKARKTVEEYMFDNRIPGPYGLYLL